jgi:hypothetical protein
MTDSLLYKVVEIEKTGSHESDVDSDWYRYTIGNGRSTIEGERSGTLNDVTDYLAEYVEQLNERKSMDRTQWRSRGKKPAQTIQPAKTEVPAKD